MLTRRFNLSFICLTVVITVVAGILTPTAKADNRSKPTHRILKSASEFDYPPFALVRPDGSADGFSVDLLKVVTQAVGLEINFMVGPWHKIKQKLVDGHLDVLPLVSYSQEREKVYDFTAPYLRMHGTIFVRKGEKTIRGRADLKDKEVIVMRGDTAHEYAVRENLSDKLILTATFEEAMRLLSKGKHDAVIIQQLVGLQLIKKLGISNVVNVSTFQETSLKPIDQPLSGFEQKFCFAVQDGDKELLSLLNEGLAIAIANGTYDELYNKWFIPILPQPPVPLTLILKYLLFILVPILFLLGIMGLWYLKREVAQKTQNLNKEIKYRKQVGEALQKSEQKYRQLVEQLQEGIWAIDKDVNTTYVNPRMAEMIGYTVDEMQGKHLFAFMDERGVEISQRNLERRKQGIKEQHDFELIHKNGQRIYTSMETSPITDEQGNYIGALACVADITDRRKAEEELSKLNLELEERVKQRTEQLEEEIAERVQAETRLAHTQKMLKAVFDGISDPLVLLGRDMRLKMLNRAAADYYGLSEDLIILESKCHQMLRDSAAPCQGCEVPTAISSGKITQFERKGFMDPEMLEKVYLYPVKYEDSNVWDILIRISDITEQRLLEEQIIQNEKMASLGVLISSVAHEINNPISFISFNIPILRDYIEELMPIVDAYAAEQPDFEICNMPYADFHEDISKLLDNLDHGSVRIKASVSNLKEFSHVKDKVEEKWIDLNLVIESVLSISQIQLLKNVKSFVTHIPENLPKIWSDPYALEQILLNLLINAAQAASDKKDLEIVLSVEIRNSWLNHLILEVIDNGNGIDEKTKKKIFDPFFTTKSLAEGTGLGLYVCHGLVHSLRGRIEVESEPEKGSKFRVIFPDKDRRNKKRL